MGSNGSPPGAAGAPESSWAKIVAAAGGISSFLAALTAILTHIDTIRDWVFRTFGYAVLESAHIYVLSLTIAAALFGLSAIAYWIYQRYISSRSDQSKLAFILASVFVVTSGAYIIGYVIPRPVEPEKILQKQASDMAVRIF